MKTEEKKQETLEERQPYWELVDKKAEENNTIDLDAYANGVRDGVNWQAERMYSEEEVFNLCRGFAIFVSQEGASYEKQLQWFEQKKNNLLTLKKK